MRQAIEEGFILDVLQNYTPYKLAFKLAHNGKEMNEKEVERSEAMKHIMRWVKLHPYNSSQKVQIVVEHFRENVAPLLDGQAKAMVVVGSRLEAVRWKLAIEKYIQDQNYNIGTLVAFSTAPNGVALDGPVGEHSIYAKHLLQNIQTPGLPVEQLFKRVRIGVADETQRVQVPWESSSLTSDFCFKTGTQGQCG